MVTPYRIAFTPRAQENFERLDKLVSLRILTKLKWLSENLDTLKLEALTGDFEGLFKLRVGDYRVLYSASRTDRLITIRAVGHRSDIYK